MKYASIEEITTLYRTYYLNCPHITALIKANINIIYLQLAYFIVIHYKVGGVGVMYDNFTGRRCVCGPAGRHCHGNKGVSAGAGWSPAH